jgi:hypothetical protein
MNITLSLAPLVSLLAGILVLAVPRMLSYIVAAYLIVIGLLGLFGDIRLHWAGTPLTYASELSRGLTGRRIAAAVARG